jgi:hypothetical protein
MEWFRHDSNANLDDKLQQVLLNYGLEGYGLYWYCIELIVNKVSATNITFELKHDARVIARNTGSTPQKVEEMMKHFVELGLFESNVNGLITCLKVATRLSASATSNQYMRKIIHNINTNNSLQVQSCHRHDDVMKEEKRIEEKTTSKHEGFDDFYKAYPKKKSRGDAEKAWNSLKPDLESVLSALEWQIKAEDWIKDDGKYIPYPASYLRNKSWLDDKPVKTYYKPTALVY